MPLRYASKTDLVLAELRKRIRSGEAPPGTPLRVEALTAEFGISSTPVREALRILQADGLVNHEPHRGASVAERLHTLKDVYDLRLLLEPEATRRATEAMDEAGLAELERLHAAYVEAARKEAGAIEISRYNSSWHKTIYRRTPALWNEFIDRLWDALPWRTSSIVVGPPGQLVADHERIMDAIRAGDGERAAEDMRVHLLHGFQAHE